MNELARSVAEGHLDLEGLATLPDGEAIDRLCGLRGVGRWTAEYVLLRGLGRTHVFPGDDVGARNNLQRWLGDRIRVEQVTVSSDPGFEETVTIEIVYVVKATQERQRVQVQV